MIEVYYLQGSSLCCQACVKACYIVKKEIIYSGNALGFGGVEEMQLFSHKAKIFWENEKIKYYHGGDEDGTFFS